MTLEELITHLLLLFFLLLFLVFSKELIILRFDLLFKLACNPGNLLGFTFVITKELILFFFLKRHFHLFLLFHHLLKLLL